MRQETNDFETLSPRGKAAYLVAEDSLRDEQIANKVGVHRATLARWKNDAEFAAQVEEYEGNIRFTVRKYGIGILERRVRHLDDRHRRLRSIIEKRSIDPAYADEPGGETGLLTRKAKSVYNNDDDKNVIVYDYEVDTAVLKELREIEKQTSQELGQWIEKGEFKTSDLAVESDPEKTRLALTNPEALEHLCAFDELIASPPRVDSSGVRESSERREMGLPETPGSVESETSVNSVTQDETPPDLHASPPRQE